MNRSRWMLAGVALVAALALGGGARAAVAPLYDWLTFERDLSRSFQGPEQKLAYEDTLKRLIARAEGAGRKPPPGVLAEYGFLLYERGETHGAVRFFQREAQEWPESAALMDRLIELASEVGAP